MNQANLDKCATHALDNLETSEWKATNPPSAEDKRVAKYEVGRALITARKELPVNEEFGEWCRVEIIEKSPHTKTEAAWLKALYSYRQLAEFGSLEHCTTVGFTNVYKLMQKDNIDLCEEVKQILIEYPVPRLAKPDISAVMKGEQRPSVISTEEKVGAVVSALTLAQDKSELKTELLHIVGLGTTATSGEIRRKKKELLLKVHPERGGDAEIFHIVKSHFDHLINLDK